MEAAALGGVAIIFVLIVWGIALAMMVLSIIFIIKVPKYLEGIERELKNANALRAERLRKETASAQANNPTTNTDM